MLNGQATPPVQDNDSEHDTIPMTTTGGPPMTEPPTSSQPPIDYRIEVSAEQSFTYRNHFYYFIGLVEPNLWGTFWTENQVLKNCFQNFWNLFMKTTEDHPLKHHAVILEAVPTVIYPSGTDIESD